jgi:hypothetical protein
LGVFANNVFAEACFCGNTCLHSIQTRAKTKANFLIHLRCSGNLCKSCNLETGQILKAVNSETKNFNIKIFDTALIILTLIDYSSVYHTFEDFGLCYKYEIIISLPVYLQNLSILC